MDELTEKLMGLLASKENVEKIKNLSGLLLEGKESRTASQKSLNPQQNRKGLQKQMTHPH